MVRLNIHRHTGLDFHVCTGFKPGQRKVMYTCFKRNDKKDIKVAQLAGSVAEISAYHHGEVCSPPWEILAPFYLFDYSFSKV